MHNVPKIVITSAKFLNKFIYSEYLQNCQGEITISSFDEKAEKDFKIYAIIKSPEVYLNEQNKFYKTDGKLIGKKHKKYIF